MQTQNIICCYVKGCIKFNTLGINSIKTDCQEGYNM